MAQDQKEAAEAQAKDALKYADKVWTKYSISMRRHSSDEHLDVAIKHCLAYSVLEGRSLTATDLY